MRIDGDWRLFDDGVTRPLFSGALRAANGTWAPTKFLADCGADQTVLSCDAWEELGLQTVQAEENLVGVGGKMVALSVETQIRLVRENGSPVVFKGRFPAVTDPLMLDTCVLGRDITNLFALVVDRPNSLVCMVGGEHACVVVRR